MYFQNTSSLRSCYLDVLVSLSLTKDCIIVHLILKTSRQLIDLLSCNKMTLSTLNKGQSDEEAEPWQMKVTSLADGIRYIHNNEDFWDVEFKVGGSSFKGHRLILGARSPKFAKMLLKDDPPREIRDESSKEGFEILWRFIYTDELGTTNQNEILEAYRVAIKFEQEELIGKCEELIGNMDITGDNVFSILNQVPDIDLLRERCINFVRQHSNDVLASEDFLKATPNTLQEIFKHNCLESVSALVLQCNILRWGCNQFSKIENYKLVRDLLLSIRILGKLKIHMLAVEELADFDMNYPELLTSEEYKKFSLHAFKPSLPLPEWCEV